MTTTTPLAPALQRTLDASEASNNCDRRLHPRIARRLDDALRLARNELQGAYPQIEDWLFGYPYRFRAERIVELRRVTAEHAALAGIANPAAVRDVIAAARVQDLARLRTALAALDKKEEGA